MRAKPPTRSTRFILQPKKLILVRTYRTHTHDYAKLSPTAFFPRFVGLVQGRILHLTSEAFAADEIWCITMEIDLVHSGSGCSNDLISIEKSGAADGTHADLPAEDGGGSELSESPQQPILLPDAPIQTRLSRGKSKVTAAFKFRSLRTPTSTAIHEYTASSSGEGFLSNVPLPRRLLRAHVIRDHKSEDERFLTCHRGFDILICGCNCRQPTSNPFPRRIHLSASLSYFPFFQPFLVIFSLLLQMRIKKWMMMTNIMCGRTPKAAPGLSGELSWNRTVEGKDSSHSVSCPPPSSASRSKEVVHM